MNALKRLTVLLTLTFVTIAAAAQELPEAARAAIDKSVNELLVKSGAPSASIAIVKDGSIVYTNAYGLAKVESKTAANPEMRYSIGSISKQFTAAAVMLLAEEGKLSLDDRVVRWFPELTRARDVSIRHLLTMTSGYSDFWPQDYVMPMMLQDTTPEKISDAWAKKGLDFVPGAKSQYSNTNYVIAGMIVERASGMPFMEFLQKRIFTPLGMKTVYDTDQNALPAADAGRYMRFGLGPARPAPKEGKGWMFAAGELAMTARDLALWDISVINQTLLQPASYREMQREMQLTAGNGVRYGLGVSISTVDGRRLIAHGGEVSGFTARNEIYPDERAAIVVLTNLDGTPASEQIASKIAGTLFASTDTASPAALEQAKVIFEKLQRGEIDRSLFTSNANAYFSQQALKDIRSSLGPLGKPQEFAAIGQGLRGGMTLRRYRVRFADKALRITTFVMPDGKIEQYMVAAGE
jgi:CubicO group peptidase (beta-lactamase class C family)